MDQREFPRFYQAYLKRIYKFVFYRVGAKKEVAQDLTQDIFLKAYEAFDRYDPAKGEVAWIYTIARNHLINHLAKQRPGIDFEEVEGSVWTSVDFRERFIANEKEAKLMEAINRLSDEDAELIRMKYLEGWSFDELAELFGRSSGSLRVSATRLLKKLKSFFKQSPL